jgi:hypothetical protein
LAEMLCLPKRKRPCGFPQGLERRAVANLVLSNERLRCLRSPDLEANARPHVDAVRALRGIVAHEAVGDPELQINRAEVIADQTA